MDESGSKELPGFEEDGSLRDIYVFDTTPEDWGRFLEWARRSYPTEFRVGYEPREMPDDLAAILELWRNDPVLLAIFVDGVQINCHFFRPARWPGELELDVDPTEVRTPEQGRLVLDFLKQLGDAMNRTALLTAENSPEIVIYRYEPQTAGPKYVFVPYSERDSAPDEP
jgi:hypothetical protein